MEQLFAAIRSACLPAIWTRAVELTRTANIYREPGAADELNFRITGTGPVSPRGTLWPSDACWSCDCSESNDPCTHVAAAAIAFKSGNVADAAESEPLKASKSGETILYSFERSAGRLLFHRFVRDRGAKRKLTSSLRAHVGGISSGRIRSAPVDASQSDYAIDSLLGDIRDSQPSTDSFTAILSALHGLPNIELDGQPVRTRREAISFIVVIEDGPSATVVLRRELTEAVDETFKNNVARVGDVLRPIARYDLPLNVASLISSDGTVFQRHEVQRLVSEVIPVVMKHLKVEIRSVNVPRVEKMPPRIVLETEVSDDSSTMRVLPRIIYGRGPEFEATDDGFAVIDGSEPAVIPLRDRAEEQRLERDLRLELHLAVGRFVEFQGTAALAFLTRAQDWEVRGKGAEQFAVHGTPSIVPRWEGNRFEVSCNLSGHTATIGFETVLQAWRSGTTLIPLTGGGFAKIPEAFLAKFAARLDEILAARDNSGNIRGPLAVEAVRLSEELGVDAPEALRQIREKLLSPAESAPPASQLHRSVTLRNYQEDGVKWLNFLAELGFGGLLADDMGLGKTIQAIAVLKAPALVVAPTSVLSSWTEQLRAFRPSLRVSLYTGAGRVIDLDSDVVITSYGILRLDTETLSAREWEVVVLDESQQIKNPDSQVAQAAHRLIAHTRFALTGTPLENRLEELWSQFHFLNPGLLGTREGFVQRFVRADADASSALQARVRPFILRRLKRDVAPELPPRTESVLHCELSDSENELYQSLLAATRKEVQELLRSSTGLFGALERLLRLRQACCHPALLSECVPASSEQRSAKLELLMDRLEETKEEGHRALVFSQWTSMLDLTEPELKRRDISFDRLDGTTRDREGVVRRFQQSDGPSVLLLSLKAGGTGLTLTGADHVFLLDPWWNPAVEDQAADRAHRIGQERPVMVYRLIAKDTIEERILELQDSKRALLDAVVSGDAASTHALSRDDILKLLG